MSYILDALNKSEQERRGQQTPDLQTVHRAPPPKAESKFPTLAVIGVFALLNIGAIGYWLSTSDEATPATNERQPIVNQNPEPAVSTIASSAPSKPIITEPVVTPTTPETAVVNTEGTLITPQTAFQPAETQPVRITELPLNVQRQIPDLVFSSHLYSGESSFRMVNINGKMRREGDMVANDLKLREISEEGVVLEYRHYVFEVSVLRDWSFN